SPALGAADTARGPGRKTWVLGPMELHFDTAEAVDVDLAIANDRGGLRSVNRRLGRDLARANLAGRRSTAQGVAIARHALLAGTVVVLDGDDNPLLRCPLGDAAAEGEALTWREHGRVAAAHGQRSVEQLGC